MRSVFLSAIAFVALHGGSARADEVLIPEDEDAYVVEVPDEAMLPADEFDGEARVYGWTALRPLNCGTFRYWNGAYCADARREPPTE